MEWFITFVLRSSVYLLLFALAYGLLLSRRVHPTFNRFYLLTTAILSVILGMLGGFDIRWERADQISGITTLPEIMVTANAGYNSTAESIIRGFDSYAILPALFVLFSTGMALVLLWQLTRLMILGWRYGNKRDHGLRLVELPHKSSPFSFFSWIFYSIQNESDSDFEKIMAHEKAHWQRLHSADVLFFELLRILYWFHPAFYYMRHELRAMHEYEADSLVLQQFDLPDYQRSLLETALGGSLIPLTNPYNVSLIKKRMIMMNRAMWQKPARNWFKIMLLLPFLLAAITMQSCRFNQDDKNATAEAAAPTEEQTVTTAPEQPVESAPETTADTVFTVVEVMPEFPGGSTAMMEFIGKNIQYPEEARNKKIQGRVFINFVIEKDGKVADVKLLRGIGGGCDEEALRVVKMMPVWKPGTQRGEAVRVSFNLPVNFKLS